jgi:hypothetical protein
LGARSGFEREKSVGSEGIRTIFFRAPVKPSGDLALAEYADGTIGILRDGTPVDGCRWALGDLEQAVNGFTALQRQLKNGHAHHEPSQQPGE